VTQSGRNAGQTNGMEGRHDTTDSVRATETETDEEAVPSRAYVSRAGFEAWINHSRRRSGRPVDRSAVGRAGRDVAIV